MGGNVAPPREIGDRVNAARAIKFGNSMGDFLENLTPRAIPLTVGMCLSKGIRGEYWPS